MFLGQTSKHSFPVLIKSQPAEYVLVNKVTTEALPLLYLHSRPSPLLLSKFGPARNSLDFAVMDETHHSPADSSKC